MHSVASPSQQISPLSRASVILAALFLIYAQVRLALSRCMGHAQLLQP